MHFVCIEVYMYVYHIIDTFASWSQSEVWCFTTTCVNSIFVGHVFMFYVSVFACPYMSMLVIDPNSLQSRVVTVLISEALS